MTYTYQDVYNSTLEYFNGDDLATNVWITKYCKSKLLEDGTTLYYERTPDDMFHRIASEISRAGMKYNNPLSENEVYDLIKDYKYILFAGRPMAGIGVDDAVSISNCFVVGRPGQDSYGTIATIDQEIMQLSKRGGGVGTDLSDYRPNGAKVHNAARTSSGPVEICANRFSNTIREVGQNGRRGALMLSMDITHPSAEEFMDAKMEDGKITGANISVKLYDDWMKSALGIDCEMDKEKNRLWKKIIHNATTKAEPGVLFWDTVLRESPADCYADYGFKTISTNPCVTGDTMVAVADGRGYVPIKQLADEGNDVPVYTYDRNGKIVIRMMRNPRITGYNQKIYKINFYGGASIKCTENHKFLVTDRYYTVKDLIDNEMYAIKLQSIDFETKSDSYNFETFEKNGIQYVNRTCEHCGKSFTIEYDKREIAGCSDECFNHIYTKKHSLTIPHDKTELLLMISNIEILEYPEDVYNGTVDDYHNFFVGDIIFGEKHYSLNNLQCGEIPLAAGDACRLMSLNLYSYVIDPFTENARFDFDKFINHSKLSIKLMDNMIDLENEKIDRILAKIDSDPETDETKAVEENLWNRVKYMNNFGRRSGIGFTALGDMLAALNLKYGSHEATEFVEFIQKVMATSVYIGSCDLVQVDNRPSFGCFSYDLEKDNPFLNRLTYPFVNTFDITNSIENLVDEFKDKWSNGRRNIALLTCAPAGSLSTQSQTTSGLEPVFMISYRRRRKIDKNSGIKADFIDKTGDHFIEFNVVHNKFIEWYRIHRNTNLNNMDNEMTFNEAKTFLEGLSTDKLNDIIKQSPYFGATAMDCDWHERINMQAALQRYVDHSLSVTCNLPKGTSEEVVEDVYRTAWLSGCKGCTIYVDGCRDGVLVNKEEKKCECNKFMESVSPKRPKKLPCQIVRFSNKGTKWIAAVGLYEDKPYEIFTGIAEKLEIPTNAKDTYIVRTKVNKEFVDEDTGEIITKKVSRYDIEYVDENGNVQVVEGLSSAFNPEYWNYAKLISGLFRHGMPPHYVAKVVESMDFKDEGINTWKNGIIRALKPFMKDEKTGDKCPKCGAELWRVSGCIQCPDCGWSKCG